MNLVRQVIHEIDAGDREGGGAIARFVEATHLSQGRHLSSLIG
jgi:hypothetical protein